MNNFKLIAVFCLFITILIGCKKEKNTMEFSFSWNINEDIKIKPDETLTGGPFNGIPSEIPFVFNIRHEAGNAEDITITVTGLPNGITFSPTIPQTYPASLFTVNTSTTVSFVSMSASSSVVAGTYPVVITAKSTSGFSKSITFNLIVEGCIVTENSIQGVYTGSWMLGTLNLTSDNLTITDSANNRVIIQSNFYASSFKATLSGFSLVTDSIIIGSVSTTMGTLNNVRAKAVGTFDCDINPLTIRLQVAKGTLVNGTIVTPLNGQLLVGTFNK